MGSLLRPAEVGAARAEHAAGRIDTAQLAAVEDRAIERLVARQEALGLKAITDGEVRRESWAADFLCGLEGTTTVLLKPLIAAHGAHEVAAAQPMKGATVTGKIGFSARHPMLQHFRFLRERTHAAAKMTIPAPAMMVSASRDWRQIISTSVYPDIREFYHDLVPAYRQSRAGVLRRLVPLPAIRRCEPRLLLRSGCAGAAAGTRRRSGYAAEDLGRRGQRRDPWAAGGHDDRHAHLPWHFRSSWFGSGGYEPIADVLINYSLTTTATSASTTRNAPADSSRCASCRGA